MTKFNQSAMSAAVTEYNDLYRGSNKPTHATRHMNNMAGAPAFSLSKEMDLYSRVCTMGLTDRFYESENKSMQALIDLIHANDPIFVAKLAVYAREKMYLRTLPLVMVVELARIHRGDQLISKMIERIIQRPDGITELLAYYQVANKRTDTKKLAKLSNQIKKGIRNVFQSGRFDEYQFAKYNRDGSVKLRDALFLTHPKPQDQAQKLLFKKITENTMEVPDTWETGLSAAGQAGESKRQVWENLIESKKLGYMALMRNLRNFLKEDISERHIEMVCDTLTNQEMVLRSKQLPFRYLSAYRSLVDANRGGWGAVSNVPDYVTDSPYLTRILRALETAVSYSVDNLPMFLDEKVLVATDVSGSMMRPISPKSTVQQFDIGILMACIARAGCENSNTGIFGNEFKLLNLKGDQILTNVKEMYRREGEVGYSTNGWTVLQHALDSKTEYDRIMIFTDCEMYGQRYGRGIDGAWREYHARHPKTKLYLFNLNAYGTVPIRMEDNNVFLISGWSDKVFDIINRIEQGQSAIDEIMSVIL